MYLFRKCVLKKGPSDSELLEFVRRTIPAMNYADESETHPTPTALPKHDINTQSEAAGKCIAMVHVANDCHPRDLRAIALLFCDFWAVWTFSCKFRTASELYSNPCMKLTTAAWPTACAIALTKCNNPMVQCFKY